MACCWRAATGSALLLVLILLLLVPGAIGQQCTVGSVPTHPNFNIQRFTGVWYMLSMLEGTSTFDSAITHFMGHGNHMSSHFVSVKGGTCQPERGGTWNAGSVPGEFLTDFGMASGVAKMVYVNDDYTYAVIYQCFHVNADDTCAVKFVDYIGRAPVLPAVERAGLVAHLAAVCAQPGDLADLARTVPSCLQMKAAEYRSADSGHTGGSHRSKRSVSHDKASLIAEAVLLDDVSSRDTLKAPTNKGI